MYSRAPGQGNVLELQITTMLKQHENIFQMALITTLALVALSKFSPIFLGNLVHSIITIRNMHRCHREVTAVPLNLLPCSPEVCVLLLKDKGCCQKSTGLGSPIINLPSVLWEAFPRLEEFPRIFPWMLDCSLERHKRSRSQMS